MAGRARTSELPDALRPLLIIPQNIRFYERWPSGEMFGPEVSLIHEISRIRSDKECIFIKFAVSSSSLFAWDPEWTPERARVTENGKHGPIYQDFIQFVHNLTKNNNVRFEAMFWMQGERDARYPEAGRMYMENFEKLIHRLRRDLNTPDLPFLYGQINPPSLQYPAAEIVRDAQALAAEKISNVKLISTDGLDKKEDQIHYNIAGQIELGKRFAKAYSEMLDGTIPDEN